MVYSLAYRLKDKLIVAGMAMPDRLQIPYNILLNWVKTVASLGFYPYLSLYKLKADVAQDNSTVAYLGPGTSLNFVSNLVYGYVPNLTPLARIPFFNVNSTVQQLQTEYDLVIVELPYRILQLLSRSPGIVTMPYIRWQIDTQRSWENVRCGFHRTSIQSDLKKLSDSKLEYVQTKLPADFDMFYHNLFVPFLMQRHGKLADIDSYHSLLTYFRYGWLALYRQGEEIWGGAVQFAASNVIYDYTMGMLPTLTPLQRTQVTTANYYYTLQTAFASAYQTVDLGGTRPLLDDGVARYKRKWGARVLMNTSQNWGIGIKIGCNPAKAHRFLSQHPWIWLDKSNRLKGLIVVDDPKTPLSSTQIKEICQRFWVLGLSSIIVCANKGFAPDINLCQSPIPALGPATEWSLGNDRNI